MLKNKYMQAILRGLKPCIIGIILATGIYMTASNCISSTMNSFDVRATIVTLVLAAIMWGAKPVLKKKISPIMLIIVSACLGIVVYGI